MTVYATTRVALLDPVTGRRVGACRGPQPDGRCSAPCREAVACTERIIVAELAGERRRIRLFVSPGVDRCPLAQPPAIPMNERRDPELRARRDAVAHWFGLHPASLASLDGRSVTTMLGRIGRGPGRPSMGAYAAPAQVHPWAG